MPLWALLLSIYLAGVFIAFFIAGIYKVDFNVESHYLGIIIFWPLVVTVVTVGSIVILPFYGVYMLGEYLTTQKGKIK